MSEGAPSENGPLVLVVDDESPVRRFLRASLTSHGFRVVEAATGADALREAAQRHPDIVLLDLGLPDLDGLVVTQRLREWRATPIVVLSARGQERDKVAALEGGADDYLTKPFGIAELVARIRVALRHVARARAPDAAVVFEGDGLRIDLSTREVARDGAPVHLTPIEFRLLALLLQHAGKVVMQKHLLREVWGPGAVSETQYLRVHMANLRRKIERDPTQPRHVVTEPGVGYRFRE